MTEITIETPLTLPCGVTLKNRLVKAAMTEGLASDEGQATDSHVNLYQLWATSGVGLLITGNVMVDRFHMERAGNVVIDGLQNEDQMRDLKAFAAAAQQNGTTCFVQLSHSGRQCPKNINPTPKSASDIIVEMPGGQFGQPKALSEAEIEIIIDKFSIAAIAVKAAGFKGVELHAAHGYLISQFLSPKSNHRTDRWGGSLENRARLLTETVIKVREAVGDDFPIAVKLNSADFQQGGFTLEDCKQVVRWLSALKIDLLEISGGTYEQPSMVGSGGVSEPVVRDNVRASTVAREAYFMDYATAISTDADMPLMVTGGFRSRVAMDGAIGEGNIELIGIARPMVASPLCPVGLLDGSIATLPRYEDQLAIGKGWFSPQSSNAMMQSINGFAAMAWYYTQLLHIGLKRSPKKSTRTGLTFIRHVIRDGQRAKKIRNLLKVA